MSLQDLDMFHILALLIIWQKQYVKIRIVIFQMQFSTVSKISAHSYSKSLEKYPKASSSQRLNPASLQQLLDSADKVVGWLSWVKCDGQKDTKRRRQRFKC